MKVKFIKNGKVINSKAGELFIKLGLAEEIVEVGEKATDEIAKAAVVEKPFRQDENKIPVKRKTKPSAKKRGRPKVKK